MACLTLCMDLLLMYDFVTLWVNHLENNFLLNTVDTFHYAVSVTFIDSTVFIIKVLKYWKAFKFMWYVQVFQDYGFLSFFFFCLKVCFITGNRYWQFFSLVILVQNMSVRYLQPNNYCLSVLSVCFTKKWLILELSWTKWFFRRQPLQHKYFLYVSHLWHQVLRFNNICHFYYFFKDTSPPPPPCLKICSIE